MKLKVGCTYETDSEKITILSHKRNEDNCVIIRRHKPVTDTAFRFTQEVVTISELKEQLNIEKKVKVKIV